MTSTISKAEIPSKTELQAAIPPEDNPEAVDNQVAKYGHVEIRTALNLRLKHKLSYRKIGEQLNCSHEAVRQALKPFLKALEHPEAIEAYRDYRADILTGAEIAMLDLILDPEKAKKATLGNAGYVFEKVAKEAHLSRGEATANVSHHHMTTEISEIDKELRELEAERGGL
jgi:hypothetical protein